MRRPTAWLLGYRVLRAPKERAGELVELCRRGGWIYWNLRFSEDSVSLECEKRVADLLAAACAERGVPLETAGEGGLPALLWRYRHRAGLAVGGLLFCAVLFFSGWVLWDIRVEGNSGLSDREVIRALSECGMEVGDRLSTLEVSVLENRMLIASDEISWISINLIGTVAEVEIREAVPPPPEETMAAANLVAARAGEILWLEDTRGFVTVKVGDYVGEGELLVSGIYDVEGGGIRTTRAHGKVFARTKRDFRVEIPLIYEKKCYTGQVKTEKSLIFFEKEIKFYGNTGNSPTTCDTIDTVEYWELPGGVRLPVGIRTRQSFAYVTETVERGEESAMELAYYRLRCEMEGQVPRGSILRKALSATLTEEAYVLCCRAEYIEDIARVQEIGLEGILNDGTKNGKN